MNSREVTQTTFSFDLKTDMSRDDFMVSECNREAFSLIDAWPNWDKSGLIIYGPEGCGKTHLAHLFAEKVNLSQIKPTKIPFYNCEQINMKNLERICNSSDVVILENLSENINQEALFHLFNHFYEKGRYMLWTCKVPPARLNFTLKDLQSRFNILPTVAIKEPDDIMLRSLIIKLFNDRQLRINPEIVEYIITNAERSFSCIERLVKEIDEISLAYKSTINYKIVKVALENINNNKNIEPDLFF